METDSSSASKTDRDADARWLAVLAGRAHGETVAEREASMMREALRRWPVAVDAVDDDPDRIARLLERARREGLVRPVEESARPWAARPSGARLRERWRTWRAGRPGPLSALAAAGMVAVVTFIAFTRPAGPGDQSIETTPTVRSAAGAVTVLAAADPEALRAEIAEALLRQGIAATRYRRFGRFGIDADLPPQPSPTLVALLDRYRIPLPADGVLRVEIEARRP